MRANEDLYKILGVARHATPEKISMAYRREARRCHPDINPGKVDAEECFKRLTWAYETLSDPKRRAAYDAALLETVVSKTTPRHAYSPVAGYGVEYDDDWIQGEWDDFVQSRVWEDSIASTFRLDILGRWTHGCGELVLWLGTLFVLYKSITSKVGFDWLMFVIFTSKNHPGGSLSPSYGLMAGFVLSAVITAMVAAIAAYKYYALFRESKVFRSTLVGFMWKVFSGLSLVLGLAGIAVGHTLF